MKEIAEVADCSERTANSRPVSYAGVSAATTFVGPERNSKIPSLGGYHGSRQSPAAVRFATYLAWSPPT